MTLPCPNCGQRPGHVTALQHENEWLYARLVEYWIRFDVSDELKDLRDARNLRESREAA